MRRADKDGTIRELVTPLLGQDRQIHAGGAELLLDHWYTIVSTLDQLDTPVQVYDADVGMQLVKTPARGGIGWITPNPLREG